MFSVDAVFTEKSCRPQNKTFIRGASPGISCKLRDIKDAIGGRSWYVVYCYSGTENV